MRFLIDLTIWEDYRLRAVTYLINFLNRMDRHRSQSDSRSRSRSPIRHHRHKRDIHSPKRRHKSHTQSKDYRYLIHSPCNVLFLSMLYRESRYSSRRRTRSRSKSPVVEEKERAKKKINSEKKKSYRKDYSGRLL